MTRTPRSAPRHFTRRYAADYPFGRKSAFSSAAALTLPVLLLGPVPATGGTFYVDNLSPAASDANPGTAALPYKTISGAVATHHGLGTTILVRPGIYRETVTVPASGDSTGPFVLRATGSGVVIDGADDFSAPAKWAVASGTAYLAATVTWSPLQVFVDGTRLVPSTAAPSAMPAYSFQYVAGAGLYVNLGGGSPGGHQTLVGKRLYGVRLASLSWVQVDGFAVTRSEDKAVYLSSATHCTVRNCTVSFSRKYGIHAAGGASNLIEKNTVCDHQFHGIGLVSGAAASTVQDNECCRNADPAVRVANGIYLSAASGNLLRRNRCHDNQDSGVNLGAASDNNLQIENVAWNNGDRGFDHLDSKNAVLIGCVAYGNTSDGFSFDGTSSGGQLFDCIAANNGVGIGRFDLWVGPSAATGFQSNDNLLWNSTAQPPVKYIATSYATVGAFSAASGTDTRTRQADPRFVNAAAGDFHLQAGSPAIDNANSGLAAWPATDADTKSRIDDPLTPNTGVGPVSYADRGAYEYQPSNLAPNGTIDSPAANVTIAAGQAVNWKGTGSDPDNNTPLSYAWSFGGGAPASAVDDPGPVIFATAGTYTVGLTVTDALGLADPTPATRIVTVTAAPTGVPADEIHWTMTGQNSVTIDWRGFDTVVRYGLTPAYGSTAAAVTPSPLPFSSPGPFKEAWIKGLQENTVYHYSIGSGPDHTFQTPPPRGAAGFTIFAEGDIGSSIDFAPMAPLQSVIAAERPAFVLMIGDLTYGNSTSQASVDQHFNDVMVWSQDAAYMPVWGNHEWDSSRDDLRNYRGRFDLPHPQAAQASPAAGGEDWSWFDYGNVRFISYPEPYTLPGTWSAWHPQATLLMDQAEADPAIRFIVTFGHRPPYSSGHHPDDGIRPYLDALAVTHAKYVLNLSGHSHDYERTYPQRGVVHVTAGTGGADIEMESDGCAWRGGCPPPAWSAFRAMRHVNLRLRFYANGILGEAICGPPDPSNDIACTPGAAIDRFVIGTLDVAPVVSAPATAAVDEGGKLTVNVSASDPDGIAIANLSASGLPAGAGFTPGPGNTSGTLRWTPTYSQAGTYTVTFTAANTSSGSATTVITVGNVNRPPVVTAPATAGGLETTVITFTVYAFDPDGETTASLSVSGLPPNATFSVNTSHTVGTFTWTPATGQSGIYPLVFTAANALSSSATTTATVTASGAPVVTAPATANVMAGSLLTVGVTASDNEPIQALSAAGLPSGASFTTGPKHTTGTLTWTPTLAQTGPHDVTFRASNALSGWAITRITVTGDRAPVVSAPPTASVQAGAPLALDVTASDPDGDPIASLTASNLSGAVFAVGAGNRAGRLTWTPAAADVGSRTVTFTAANALSGSASTAITVRPPNQPPVPALSVTPATGNEPVTARADASASTDPDGSVTSFTFDFGDGTTQGPQSSPSATHTYRAGMWALSVTVTDNQGASATKALPVCVAWMPGQSNLVANPSFEVGTSGWGATPGVTMSRAAGGFDGSWALQMSGPLSVGGFGCNDAPNWVAAVPAAGTHYRCTAWVRAPLVSGTAKIQLREYSGASKVGDVVSPGVVLCPDWQLLTADYVSGAAGSALDLQILDSPLVADEVFIVDHIALFNTTSLVGVGDSIPDLGGRTPLVATVAPIPLRTTSTLSFVTSRPGPLRVTLFDLGGRRVRTVLDLASAPAGFHTATVDGEDDGGRALGSGLYFYRIRALEGVSTGRIVIVR